MRLLLFIAMLMFTHNLAAQGHQDPRPPFTVTYPLTLTNTVLEIDDDLQLAGLEEALDRQLESYQRYPLEGQLLIDGQYYDKSTLKRSALLLKEIAAQTTACYQKKTKEACHKIFNQQIQEKFKVFAPAYENGEKDAQFTAYYSPLLQGSHEKSAQFPHGIYARPADDELRLSSSRVDIDLDGKLEGKGLNLFYTDNLFELYLMHIEGGGKVEVQTPTGVESYYLSFDGTNQQSWRFISRYMVDQGMINSHAMDEQKRFLDANPQTWREVYHFCPSYIYFKVTETPPVGLDEIPLTDNRSMAQDRNLYAQKGMIGVVQTEKPVMKNGRIEFVPFMRLFIDQDTGGAIRGKARADLYFGIGEEGRLAGHNLNRRGSIHFLLAL